jgi:hypothetical protein
MGIQPMRPKKEVESLARATRKVGRKPYQDVKARKFCIIC